MKKCDCSERIGVTINSQKCCFDMEKFFEEGIKSEKFIQISASENINGFYKVETNNGLQTFWKPINKWFKCNCCNCVWEFQYPDFPQLGYVKKYVEEKSDLIY